LKRGDYVIRQAYTWEREREMKFAAIITACCCYWAGAGVLSADQLIVGGDFHHLPIPDKTAGVSGVVEAYLPVGQHGIISDIDVYLDITHSSVSDLKIELSAPWGGAIVLKEDWPTPFRDPQCNMYGTIFDDDALVPLDKGQPPYTGIFQVVTGYSLAGFNGYDPYGIWTLRIYDRAYYDTGTLDNWQLYITHTPEPISLAYVFLGGLLVRRYFKSRRP